MKRKFTLMLALVLVAITVLQGSSAYAVTNTKSTATQDSGTYKVRDAYFELDDTSVNRATSEHFQIIWGNEDTTGTVDEEFVQGNLENLESIWAFYVNVLGMSEIGISQNSSFGTTKYKTNLYISNTGLGDVVEDDWAYMSVDKDAFGYMVLMPGAMRVDAPSWVIPHELAHVFTYHQGGIVQEGWYEATANWFRDQYLGSEYYAYGDTVYGPASDFFAPYILNSAYYFPHLKNWYDAWPILLYISENPDNIDGLGMDLIHKILENDQVDDTLFATIERLSGVSIKDILGGLTRRLVTMDFDRQQYYLEYLNELLQTESNVDAIYTTLNSTSDGYLTVSSDDAPMQGGYNIIPLDVDLTKGSISVEFVGTSTETGADYRTSIVTVTADNKTRYSSIYSEGTNSINLHGDETKAYLVVCATPDTMQALDIYDETYEGTRYTYKVKVSVSDKQTETESESEAATESEAESETEKETEKETVKETEKETTTKETEKVTEATSEESEAEEETTVESVKTATYIHNFTTNGIESDFYTIKGKTSSSKGTVHYNDLTLTKCLKMESSTKITFTTEQEGDLTLVFSSNASGAVKIDGKKYTYKNGILEVTLEAGKHTITKSGSSNLYYISLTTEREATEEESSVAAEAAEDTSVIVYAKNSNVDSIKAVIEFGDCYACYVKTDSEYLNYQTDFDFTHDSLVLYTSYLDTLQSGTYNIYVGLSDDTYQTVKIKVVG